MTTSQATIPAPAPRRFWQLHLSTAIVLTLLTGTLIGLNCLPTIRPSERAYGWPFPVVRFLGELPGTVRWDWPLWFDVVSNVLIVFYGRIVWEHLTRQRATPGSPLKNSILPSSLRETPGSKGGSRRQPRVFQRAASRLIHGTTAFFVALATVLVLFLNFYPRAPQAPASGQLYGWPMVVYRDVRYVFDGTEQEWLTSHSADKTVIQHELGGIYTATVNRDEATQRIHLVMTNSARLATDASVLLQADTVAGLLLILSAAICAEWIAIKRTQHIANNRMGVVSLPNNTL